jgi:outer membrane protein OmpA-like peptidoglycan-associated protein
MEALSRGLAVITPPGAALQDVYYEFDSIDLKADAAAILKKNAEWMKANPLARVEVEGHCDDVGSAEYNLALGAKRAQRARDFLMEEGIAPDRLVTISYGKEAPACLEPNEECRLRNPKTSQEPSPLRHRGRRYHFYILRSGAPRRLGDY